MSVRGAYRRPRLEVLEDRWVPAGPAKGGTVVWINPSSGSWSDPMNWSSGVVPTAANDVVIPSGVLVTFSDPNGGAKSLTCDGTFAVDGGFLALSEASTIHDLALNGGLYASGGLSVETSFYWSGGTLGGATVTLSGSALISDGAEGLTLDGATLQNHADLVWTSGSIFSDAGTFENEPDGVVRITGGVSLEAPFVNAGSLIVSTPAPFSFSAVHTSGDVTLESGGLSADSFVQTAGETHDEGAALKVATYELEGGSFTGFGTIDGDVDNGGTFAPSDGAVTVTGDYDQADDGTLMLELGDPKLAGQAPLVVNGTATLAGAVVLDLADGVELTEGDVYEGLRAGARVGPFDVLDTVTENGLALRLDYRRDGFDLTAVKVSQVQTTSTDTQSTDAGDVETTDTGATDATDAGTTDADATDTGTTDTSDDPTILNNGSGQAFSQGVSLGVPTGGAVGGGPGGPPGAAPGGPPNPANARSGDPRGPLQEPPSGGAGRPDSLPPQTQQPADGPAQPGKQVGGAERAVAGRKMGSTMQTESSGLADELFSALPLALPEIELPSERELLSTADVAAALLVGGRARANLVRGGSQLSGVATVLASEDGGEGGPDLSPFAGLYLSPLAGVPARPPGEPISRADGPADAAFEGAEAHWPDRGLALAGVAAVVLGGGSAERGRRRRRSRGRKRETS